MTQGAYSFSKPFSKGIQVVAFIEEGFLWEEREGY
jgi:hypothetical protein